MTRVSEIKDPKERLEKLVELYRADFEYITHILEGILKELRNR